MYKWIKNNKTNILYTGVQYGTFLGTVALSGVPFVIPALLLGWRAMISSMQSDRADVLKHQQKSGYGPLLLPKTHPMSKKVEMISKRMGMDRPEVFMRSVKYHDYNAFSWSEILPEKKATVLLSSTLFLPTYPGRLPVLNEKEQEAVITHELLHIKRRDPSLLLANEHVNIVTSACVFVGVLGAMFGILPIPAVAGAIGLKMIQKYANMAHGREIEMDVDRAVVKITKDPESYASALNKTEAGFKRVLDFQKNAQEITSENQNGNEWVAFKRIPERILLAERLNNSKWLQTHPKTVERINEIYRVAETLGIDSKTGPEDHKAEIKAPRLDNGMVLPPQTIAYKVVKRPGNDNYMIALTAMSIKEPFNNMAENRETAADKILQEAANKIAARQAVNVGTSRFR